MTNFRIDVVVETRQTQQGLRQVDRSLDQTTNRANGLRSALSSALAFIGVAALVRQAVRTLSDFDQALANIQAVSGATTQQMVLFSQVAQELGRTTRFTASQAADALLLLSRAGFSVAESTAAVTGTLRLAQAGALDLASSADIVANTIRGFRLSAQEASAVADNLALATARTNTNVTELAEGMKFVAPVAAGLNVSLQTTTAALGVLSDAGLKASLAGTGLRRVLAELEAPSTGTQKILRRLGVTADEVKVSQVGLVAALERLRDAGVDVGTSLQIFGQRGGPAFEVLTSGIPKLKSLTTELENSGGAATNMAQIMDNTLQGAVKRALSAIEGYVLGLNDTFNIATNLKNTLDQLTGAINAASEAMGSGLRAAEADRALVPLGERINNLKREIRSLEEAGGRQGFLSESQQARIDVLKSRLGSLVGTVRETTKAAQETAKAEKEAALQRTLAAESVAALQDPLEKQIQQLQDQNEVLQTQATLGQEAARVKEIELALARQDVDLKPEQLEQLRELIKVNEELNAVLDERSKPQKVVNVDADNERIRSSVDALLRQAGAAEELRLEQEELNRRLADGTVSTEAYARAMEDLHLRGLEASNALADGFERAAIKLRREAEDLASAGEKVVNVFADKATDALVKFAETGKFSFKEFANAILSDITRIIARLLIVQALSAAFGGGSTAAISAAAGAGGNFGGGRAEGGTVQPNRSFVVGERGPELFVPNQTGTIVPNSGSQAAPQVNVQVVNVDDPDMVPRTIAGGNADEAIINVLARNKDRAKQVLA